MDRILVGVIAVVVGGGLGWLAHQQLVEPEQVVLREPQVVKQELTAEELAEVCADLTQTEQQRLAAAQANVTGLQSRLDEREKELADLKAKSKKGAEAAAANKQRMEELEAEVQRLSTELATVTQERDELLVELKETVTKLEAQIRETEKARTEAKKWKTKSTENAWQAFFAEAKLQICDRGTERRHEKCHEAVDGALSTEIRDRFEQCVDSYQLVPVLTQLEKKAELPVHAVLLGDDNRFTRSGWYIQFCDPTLPEAQGI